MTTLVDKFYFVKLDTRYLTIKTPKSPTQFLGFSNIKNAEKCRDYIKNFNKQYGTWPSFDMSKTSEKITYEMSTDSCKEVLYIDEKEISEIEHMMHRSNSGILYCYEFGVIPYKNTQTLNLKGQDFELLSLNNMLYLNALEDCLKIT